MAATTCKNCGITFQGNYCNNCGQAAQTHSINWHYVWHDIQHGIFHVDKGILYTAKELFTRPGASIREFIDGKRVRHFKPISMVFVLATLVGFLNHYFGINEMYSSIQPAPSNAADTGINITGISDWIYAHYAFTTLLGVPVFALASKICFRKSGYNFLEHFVLNSFIAGQKLIIQLVTIPIMYYCKSRGYDVAALSLFLVVDVVAVIITFVSFFKNYSLPSRVIRALLSYVLYFMFYVAILLIGVLSWLFIVYGGIPK